MRAAGVARYVTCQLASVTVNWEVEQLQLLCMLPRLCGRCVPCNLAACQACTLQRLLIWQVASRA